jgi:hypothetical protein
VWVTPDWVDETMAEARRRSDEERDRAADFGTQAHALIEATIRGERPEVPPALEPVMTSFEAWRHEAGLEVHMAETLVYSARYRYAGTMDALAYRRGPGDASPTLVALDWKTGNGLYPEYALQVAAYARALTEMSGQQVNEVWLVRLGKSSPAFEAKRLLDPDTAFNAFRAALYLWRSMQASLF